ncbi:MAG: nucleotidyltransferase domain-containing protein [Chloroflexi bacterium]|nr:nucleotidyltransferase domain-containing protein [Chloroflexota bacterium]
MTRERVRTRVKKTVHERPATYKAAVATQPKFKRVTRRQINAVVRKIVDEFNPEKIILFGSYAYGKPTIDSDVDLLVVMESEEHRARRGVKILNQLLDVPFPLDVLVRTPQEIQSRIDMQDYFMREIVQRGRLLYAR